MCDGTSSNRRPNMWHFSLRATMSLHLLRFESVRLLLTCYLTQCVYTSSPSYALNGQHRDKLPFLTICNIRALCVLVCTAVSVLPHMHPSRVLEQQYILLCFATYVFLNLSNSLCFTGQVSVLQRSYGNSGHSIKVTYRLRKCFTSQSEIKQNMKEHAASILTAEQKRMLKSVIFIHFCSYRCWN
jgi:hypothetical protein